MENMQDLLIEAFGEGTKHVLKNMAMVEAVRGEPLKSEDDLLNTFISGTVGMIGDNNNISVSISFSKAAVYRIYSAMFPENVSDVTFSGIGDLVGEVVNMISGTARNILSSKGHKFTASMPSVVIGTRQYVHRQSGTLTKIIPFSINGDPLYLDVSVKG